MSSTPDPAQVAAELRVGIGMLLRELRGTSGAGDLTLSESAVLSRLDRGGPSTASGLAKAERISPQSVGATVSALEARGLVARAPDPADGRRVVLSVTGAGRALVNDRRDARTAQLVKALAELTSEELEIVRAAAPLLERLAQSV